MTTRDAVIAGPASRGAPRGASRGRHPVEPSDPGHHPHRGHSRGLRSPPGGGGAAAGTGATTFMWARASHPHPHPHHHDHDDVPASTSPSPTAADAGHHHGVDRPTTRSMPRPPTSAVPAQRPMARQRPMMQALDLWGAFGTPAVATRAQRASQRLGTAQRAAAGLTLADEAEFGGGMPLRNQPLADIPIVVDDGWSTAGGVIPAVDRVATAATSPAPNGRRRK